MSLFLHKEFPSSYKKGNLNAKNVIKFEYDTKCIPKNKTGITLREFSEEVIDNIEA